MSEPKQPPKRSVARETQGEGAPKRKRTDAAPTAEQVAEPRRGEEPTDAHMIERNRDAHNPEGI